MKLLFTVLSVLVVSAASHAAKIGPAGCGLGNLIFADQSQVLAATTNGTGIQTFGITSGTSNCVDSSRTAQLENFVEVNKVALANDVSRGQGETLKGLAVILGCVNQNGLNSHLKSEYQNIFKSQDAKASDVSREIEKSIRENTAVAASCHYVG